MELYAAGFLPLPIMSAIGSRKVRRPGDGTVAILEAAGAWCEPIGGCTAMQVIRISPVGTTFLHRQITVRRCLTDLQLCSLEHAPFSACTSQVPCQLGTAT